jgi:RNAse (barnase) inhibitor barstar
MSKQIITINGDNFSDIETFYDEIDRILTIDLDWKTGHNLNAFNDLLRGGKNYLD